MFHGNRLVYVASFVLLILLVGSCGGGAGGGSVGGGPPLLGGILKPSPTPYALTQTSDMLVAISGDCDVTPRILPPSVDLRRHGLVPPVQNQLWNSCVAWTLGYYVMSAVEARRRLSEPDDFNAYSRVDLSDPQHWFSPDYIYGQRDTPEERRAIAPDEPTCVETDGQLGCMRPENALRILLENGCAKWDWMCHDPAAIGPDGTPLQDPRFRSCTPDDYGPQHLSSRRSWGAARFGATPFKPNCYARFGVLDEGDRLPVKDMQAWLHEQRTPIAIVVKLMRNWVSYRGGNRALAHVSPGFPCDVVEERGVCLDATGQDLGSPHMMSIIGYDNCFPNGTLYPGLPAEKTGAFLVANQWGAKWGDEGTMWIPYSELKKIWVAGYGLMPSSGDPDSEPVCRQAISGRWTNLLEDDDVPQNLDLTGAIEITANPLPPGVVTPAAPTSVGGPDPADWYHFTTTEPDTWVDIDLSPAGLEDLDLKLTDDQQRRVGLSANRGTSPERIRRLLCEPGTYFVKVYARPGDSGLYQLFMTLAPGATFERDDDICGSTVIPVVATPLSLKPAATATTVEGSVNANGDTCDWWQLTAPQTGTLEVTLVDRDGEFACDELVGPDVTLDAWCGERPEDASLLGWVGRVTRLSVPARTLYPRTGLPAQLSLKATKGERFFLRVHPTVLADGPRGEPPGGFPNERMGYELSVRSVSSPDGDDTPAGAVPLTLEAQDPIDPVASFRWQVNQNGSLDETDVLDYYTVTVPQNRTVTIQLTGTGGAGLFAASLGGLTGRTGDDVGPAGDAFQIRAGAVDGPRRLLLVVGANPGPGAVVDYTLSLDMEFNENPARDGRVPGNDRRLPMDGQRTDMLDEDELEDWRHLELSEAGEDIVVTLRDYCAPLRLEVFEEFQGGLAPVALTAVPNALHQQTVRFTFREDAEDAWVRISKEPGAPATSYTLTLGHAQEGLFAEGTDKPVDATPLTLATKVSDRVDQTDPLDFFRVGVPPDLGDVSVTIRLTNVTGLLRVSASDDFGEACDDPDACTADEGFLDAFDLVLPRIPAGTALTLLVEPRDLNFNPNGVGYDIEVTIGPPLN